MQTSTELNEIATALAKAQSTMKHAAKSAENPFFKSHYADLASVKDACQTQLSENGIAVIQAPTTNDEGTVTLTTRFLHSSGQWIETDMGAKAIADSKGNVTAQAVGSVVTYLRRYMLGAMAGVATEDDDGESAAGRSKSTGDKMAVKGTDKEPDRIDIPAADITVDAEFWERPHLGLVAEPAWKINDWLAALRAYLNQAPSNDEVNRMWQDNHEKIEKLSKVRQYWCNEIFSAALTDVPTQEAGE